MISGRSECKTFLRTDDIKNNFPILRKRKKVYANEYKYIEISNNRNIMTDDKAIKVHHLLCRHEMVQYPSVGWHQ
jgi:hypothetical protein